MKTRSNRGIWIIGSIALVLLAVVGILSFLSFTGTEKAITNEFQDGQAVAANGAARSIESYIESLAREARALATSRIVRTFNRQAIEREIALELEELEKLGVKDIRILNAKGVVSFSANEPRAEGHSSASSGYFKQARRATSEKEVFIELVKLPGPQDARGVAIASPIFAARTGRTAADTFAGVVVITVDINALVKRFAVSKASAPSSHALLIDDQTRVIWAPAHGHAGRSLLEDTHRFTGFASTIKHMSEGKRGTAEFTYFAFVNRTHRFAKTREETFLMAYAPIRTGNASWSIGIMTPKREILGLVRSVAVNLSLLLIIVVLIILMMASYIGLQLSTAGKTLEKQVALRTSQLQKSEESSRRIAETLQEALIKPVPEISGLDIGVVYESAFEAEQVGGDFYDVFELENDLVAVLIGDVSGKGVEAAGLTETVRSSVRAFAHIDPDPAFILSNANAVIIPQASPREFATAIMLIIDRQRGVFLLASAGHPPPILLDDAAGFITVKPGLPLGSIASNYQVSEYIIAMGSSLILYTDGLPDTRWNEEFFGEIGIFKALSTVGSTESKDVVGTVVKAAMDFAHDQLSDDIAIISIRFL